MAKCDKRCDTCDKVFKNTARRNCIVPACFFKKDRPKTKLVFVHIEAEGTNEQVRSILAEIAGEA